MPPKAILTVPGSKGAPVLSDEAFDATVDIEDATVEVEDSENKDWSKGIIPKVASKAIKLVGAKEAGRLAKAAGSAVNTSAVKAIGEMRTNEVSAFIQPGFSSIASVQWTGTSCIMWLCYFLGQYSQSTVARCRTMLAAHRVLAAVPRTRARYSCGLWLCLAPRTRAGVQLVPI